MYINKLKKKSKNKNEKGKWKYIYPMLNLAMYSASIYLKTMNTSSCKFRIVLLWISVWLYSHLTMEQLCLSMLKLLFSESCCILIEAFFILIWLITKSKRLLLVAKIMVEHLWIIANGDLFFLQNHAKTLENINEN